MLTSSAILLHFFTCSCLSIVYYFIFQSCSEPPYNISHKVLLTYLLRFFFIIIVLEEKWFSSLASLLELHHRSLHLCFLLKKSISVNTKILILSQVDHGLILFNRKQLARNKINENKWWRHTNMGFHDENSLSGSCSLWVFPQDNILGLL